MAQNSCDSCTYYTYDEDYESYMCDINMDEDEYMRLLSDHALSMIRITEMGMSIWWFGSRCNLLFHTLSHGPGGHNEIVYETSKKLRRFYFICKSRIHNRLNRIFNPLSASSQVTRSKDRIHNA